MSSIEHYASTQSNQTEIYLMETVIIIAGDVQHSVHQLLQNYYAIRSHHFLENVCNNIGHKITTTPHNNHNNSHNKIIIKMYGQLGVCVCVYIFGLGEHICDL